MVETSVARAVLNEPKGTEPTRERAMELPGHTRTVVGGGSATITRTGFLAAAGLGDGQTRVLLSSCRAVQRVAEADGDAVGRL